MDLLQGFVSPVLISSIIGYLVYRFNKKSYILILLLVKE